MIGKKILDKYVGVISEIFIPQFYDEEEIDFLEDYEVHYIGFKINVGNQFITVIKEDFDDYVSLFVGDKVELIKYGELFNYVDYREKLLEKIYLYNSIQKYDDIVNIFYDNVISEEEFNNNPSYVIDYEITKINR